MDGTARDERREDGRDGEAGLGLVAFCCLGVGDVMGAEGVRTAVVLGTSEGALVLLVGVGGGILPRRREGEGERERPEPPPWSGSWLAMVGDRCTFGEGSITPAESCVREWHVHRLCFVSWLATHLELQYSVLLVT